jgi:hypothetical protein
MVFVTHGGQRFRALLSLDTLPLFGKQNNASQGFSKTPGRIDGRVLDLPPLSACAWQA